MLSLSRGVVGLVYTALIGATGYPPDYPRLFHPEGFCFFIHMAGVFSQLIYLMLLLKKAITFFNIIRTRHDLARNDRRERESARELQRSSLVCAEVLALFLEQKKNK